MTSLPLKNNYMAPKLKATTNDQNPYFPKTRDDFTIFLKLAKLSADLASLSSEFHCAAP